jgi:hypothetical protein
MELYPSWWLRYIEYLDSQFANGSGWTGLRTQCEGLEPLLIVDGLCVDFTIYW